MIQLATEEIYTYWKLPIISSSNNNNSANNDITQGLDIEAEADAPMRIPTQHIVVFYLAESYRRKCCRVCKMYNICPWENSLLWELEGNESAEMSVSSIVVQKILCLSEIGYLGAEKGTFMIYL